MGRRSSGSMPRVSVVRPRMNARVRIGGRAYWLGHCPDGRVTAEQCARATRLWQEYLSGGAAYAPVDPPAEPSEQPAAEPDSPPAGVTLATIGLRYLEHCRTYYRTADGGVTSSVAGVEMALRALFPYADLPAESFGPKAMKVVRDSLVREGRPRVTCNRVVKTIRRLFKWACSEELVSAQVWRGLEAVAPLQKGRTEAPEMSPVKEVADAVVEATIPYLPPVVQAMVRVQRHTGARPGEVCLFRPADIDRSLDVWIFTPRHHKLAWREDATPRRVTIGPEAQSFLMPYLFRSADSYCFDPRDSERDRLRERREDRKTPLYKSHLTHMKSKRKGKAAKRAPGAFYTNASYRRAVARAVAAANKDRAAAGLEPLPNWAPNQLRHTRAGEVKQRHGLEVASAVLGHTNVRTTEIYADRRLEQAVEAARASG